MVWLPSKIAAWWFYLVLLNFRLLELGSAFGVLSFLVFVFGLVDSCCDL
jgi:hypothetical protein